MPETPNCQNIFDTHYCYDHIYPRGRSGETLRAWDIRNEHLLVIKRPAPQDAPPLRAAQQVSIETERKALERLSGHPVLTELYATGSFKVGPQTHTYIALDRAEGEVVADSVLELAEQGQRLPMLEMLAIIEQLMDLIAHAHEQQVVYNDVDAKHLFWSRENYRLKVIDWGNAVLLDEGSTPPGITRQTDIYQLGELLYFIVTGGKRLDSETTPDGEHVVLFGEDTLNVPAALQAIISRATHPSLRRRYITLGDLRRALDEFRQPLESQRANTLNTVRRELDKRKSKQELEELAASINEVLVDDPGYPQAHELHTEVMTGLRRLEIQASIDAGRIHLDTANWGRASEVMLDLLVQADEKIAPVIRFIIAAAEYLGEKGRTQAPPALSPAIDALIAEEPQRAGNLLLENSDDDTLLLAEQLATLFSDISLLRPHLARLREEFGSLGQDTTALSGIETTLSQPPVNINLGSVLEVYQEAERGLNNLAPTIDDLTQRHQLNPARLREPFSRAQQVLHTIIDHLRQMSFFAYSDPRRAGEALRTVSTIDPSNPYLAQLNDYFDEIHQAIKALGSFKPKTDGSDLADWFTRVINFLQPYGDDLEDRDLHIALESLETTAKLWNETRDGFILGRTRKIKANLARMADLMTPLNKNIANWFGRMERRVNDAAGVETLSSNPELGRRLVNAYQEWDQGRFAKVVEMADQMKRSAQSEGEEKAVERLRRLGELATNWLRNDGSSNYEQTDTAEHAAVELFLPDENLERENFAKQMPTTVVYLKTMRGLIDTMRHSSTAALRILFLHYVWRGMLCVLEDELDDARFWREAALKAIPKGRSNAVFAEFDTTLTGRQLVLEAQQALNAVHSPGDLKNLRPLLNQPLADQWLGDVQQEVRQIELALRHWQDGEFREARDTLDNALQQLTHTEEHSRMKLDEIRAWVKPLRAAASELQAARLKVEQLANTTSVSQPNEAPNPQIENLLVTIVRTTEEQLGEEYTPQVLEWLATYRAVKDTHIDESLTKQEKLDAFTSHFASLFINKHPAYPLFQTWRNFTYDLPDEVEEETAAYEGEALDEAGMVPVYQVGLDEETTERKRPSRRIQPAQTVETPSQADTPAFEDAEDVIRYEEMVESGGFPWVTIAALVVVVAGVIAFVLLLGLGSDDDSGSDDSGSGASTTQNDFGDANGDGDNAGLSAATATFTLQPTSETPTFTPSPTATTPAPTATSSPTPSNTPTPTPTTEVPTIAPDMDDIQTGEALDGLAALNRLSPEQFTWDSNWFQSGAGGVWQLGVPKAEAGSGLIVAGIDPSLLNNMLGDGAAENLVAIEAEMELRQFDEDDISAGLFFGLGLENPDRNRSAAEVRVTQASPTFINPGIREDGNYRGVSPRLAPQLRFTLRLERNPDGTISHYIDGQWLGDSAPNYAFGQALAPVFYASGGDVFVTIERLELELSAVPQ